MVIFFLAFLVNPAFARGRYHHHGHRSWHGHDYRHGHGHGWNPWNAAAIGLGVAIVGSAIMNSYAAPPETVVVPGTYYHPAPPPPPPEYQESAPPPPDTGSYYDVPARVWVPGQYIYQGSGHYIYIPGHWEN